MYPFLNLQQLQQLMSMYRPPRLPLFNQQQEQQQGQSRQGGGGLNPQFDLQRIYDQFSGGGFGGAGVSAEDGFGERAGAGASALEGAGSAGMGAGIGEGIG